MPILRCPNYRAVKAALHQFILCLREQLRDCNIKVIEILPPAVQSKEGSFDFAPGKVTRLTLSIAALNDQKHQPGRMPPLTSLRHGRLMMFDDRYQDNLSTPPKCREPCKSDFPCRNGPAIGMPLDEVTEAAYAGLANGNDQIPVGGAKKR